MSQDKKTIVVLLWGFAVTIVVALVAASSLSRLQVCLLVAAGWILTCIAAAIHRWFTAKTFPSLGTVVRVPLVLALISVIWWVLLWIAWPIGLYVYPSTFTFINPPMPTETFTVTAQNRTDHKIYEVLFSLSVDDDISKAREFRLGIAPGSIKILDQSKDKTSAIADIFLYRCRDSIGHPSFVFFIPNLNAGEKREVTIESTHHSSAVVHANPLYFDEKPHSVSRDDNGNVGFDMPGFGKFGENDCSAAPTLAAIP